MMNEVLLQEILQEVRGVKKHVEQLHASHLKLASDVEQLKAGYEKLADGNKKLSIELKSLQAGQSELHQITTAIRDRQEETDAKLENFLVQDERQQDQIESLREKQLYHEKILGQFALKFFEQEFPFTNAHR